MTLSGLHGLYATEIHTDDDGSAVILDGISQSQLSVQSTLTQEGSSGFYYKRYQAVVAQKVTDTFRTFQLTDALSTIGILGKKITAATNPGVNVYAQKHADGGTRTSGSNHIKYNIKKGLIVPTRLSVDHQGDASLDYTIFVTYDGTNAPVVQSGSAALPTLSGDDRRWTLPASMTIAGKTVSGVKRFSIDFGITEMLEAADSDIWDTHASISMIEPVITFGGLKTDLFSSSNFSLEGLAATHANTSIFLRSRDEVSDAFFDDDGDSTHIKLTAAGRITPEDIFTASTDQPGETSFRLTTKFDGTNAPIVITTAQAIA